MLNLENEIKANELASKIYRVEEYIFETIKQTGNISDFKEDVIYVIHNLLERQLSKEEQTACEIVVRQQEARLQQEKEKWLQREIERLQVKVNKYDRLIEKIKNDIEEYPEARYTKYYLLDCLDLLKGE